jgi:SPW repeat
MNNIWTTGRTSLGAGWLALMVGIWLIISPFAFGLHAAAGIANNIVTGAVLILLTLASTRNGLLRTLIVLIGGWLYTSAFILPVPRGIYLWNNLILAGFVIASAVASETPYPHNYPPRAR